jgi:hypothetical protein
VQPHPLAPAGRQGAGPGPDRRVDPELADFVDEGCPVGQAGLRRGHPQQLGRMCDQRGGLTGMSGEGRTAQIAEVSDRLQRGVELLVGKCRPGDRLS